MDKQIGNELV